MPAPANRVFRLLAEAMLSPNWLPARTLLELRGSMAPHPGADLLVELGPLATPGRLREYSPNRRLVVALTGDTTGTLHVQVQPNGLSSHLFCTLVLTAPTLAGFARARMVVELTKALRTLAEALEAQARKPHILGFPKPQLPKWGAFPEIPLAIRRVGHVVSLGMML